MLTMLSGCVQVQVSPQAACLPQISYTADQETAMGVALAALAPTNPLVVFITDGIAMRRANQAVCSVNKGTTK